MDARRSLFEASLLLICTLIGSGCSEDRGARSGSTVTDSSVVPVVENDAAAWEAGEGWRVETAPAVDIGGAGADTSHQLFQVRFARRLSDGTIVVVNAGSDELRFFDSAGDFQFSVGRRGEGPGEFRDPYKLFVLPGDTLLAYDLGLQRVSVLDSRGRFIRSYRLDVPPFPKLLGTFDDGRLVAATHWSYELGPQARRPRRPGRYLLYEREGTIIDTLGTFRPAGNYVYRSRSVSWGMSLPFASSAHAAVRGERFYAGHSSDYEVRLSDANGRPVRVIRKDHQPLEVSGVDIAAWQAKHVETDETVPARMRAVSRRAIETMLQEIEVPETMPAFADLQVDELGHLWVERYRRPSDSQPIWDVFDHTGRLLGGVRTPPSMRIQQVGPDFILAICRDPMGLEHVVVYRLQRELTPVAPEDPAWKPICARPGVA